MGTRRPSAAEATVRRLALATLLPGFEGTTAPGWLLDHLHEGLAGVVLFDRNVGAAPSIAAHREPRDATAAALTAELREVRPDVVVAVDEEGGEVTRLDAGGGSDLPGAAALGVVDDPGLTERVGERLGARLRRAGITLNLAPVADVDSDPANPIIGVRSFGSDPALVARHVSAFVAGQQGQRVAAAAKHFPGHGATDQDSHLTLPSVPASSDRLRARELVPFEAAIASGTRVVMTAHVRYPALDDPPATLSRRIVTDLLRDEMGFDGVVMSDGLDMAAIARTVGRAEGAVRALAAGVDALCVGGESAGPQVVEHLVDAIVSAVRDGRLPEARLVEAAERVRACAAWTTDPAGPAHDRATGDPGREAALRAVRVHGQVELSEAPLVIELHDEPTAVGHPVPWGIGEPLRRRLPGTVVVTLRPDSADPRPALAAHPDRPVVVAVRGLRRHPWQADVLFAVRHARPGAVVVDHEIPGPSHLLGEHHLLTHSGSRVSAEIAADLLTGRQPFPAATPA